jgi:hypothetical protein
VVSPPQPEQPLTQPAESFLEFPLAQFLVRLKPGLRQELPLAARVLNPASLWGRPPESHLGLLE